MNKSKVYWAGIEYNYKRNSPKFGELTGGFVYGFIKAIDGKEALDKLIEGLMRLNMAVKVIEFITPFDIDMEWETEEQKEIYIHLYEQAKTSNQALFDVFYAYENNR